MTIDMMNMLIAICRIWTYPFKYAEYAVRYAEYVIQYAEYAIKYVKQYAEYTKKKCKAICNMQNSDRFRFCIFCTRMYSPLCWCLVYHDSDTVIYRAWLPVVCTRMKRSYWYIPVYTVLYQYSCFHPGCRDSESGRVPPAHPTRSLSLEPCAIIMMIS